MRILELNLSGIGKMGRGDDWMDQRGSELESDRYRGKGKLRDNWRDTCFCNFRAHVTPSCFETVHG